MFAVEAVSKRLAEAGISHIITAGGKLIVEAYDANALVSAPKKVVKQGKKWIITRDPKKKIKAREAYRLLMKMKRDAGYGKTEKKLAEKRDGKAKNPNRVKSAKKAWTTAPGLKAKKKAAEKASKKTAKPAKKSAKVVKKVVKKAGKKKLV